MKHIVSLSILLSLQAISLFAQPLTPLVTNNQSMQESSPPPPEFRTPYHRSSVGVRHIEANGIGYKNGYTTLEGFVLFDRAPAFMPFVDLRGHVFNDGKLAGNIGIGERTLVPSISHIIGTYLYYDVRQDYHQLTAQQLSPGVEILGKRMEYRLNAYFPVGDQKGRKYDPQFYTFRKNSILSKFKQKYVMRGVDAEIGGHLNQSFKYDLYAAAGPYYFNSPYASTWGGKTRLLGRYKEIVSLQASYSYDHLFHSVFQGEIGFHFPLGGKLKRKGGFKTNGLLLSRAVFSPTRLEIPVVKTLRVHEKAINPATGEPWVVWFVDNTSNSLGTFESPFPTLFQAQSASNPSDIIYVFPGNGTATPGMEGGIILQNNQLLLGAGISHSIATTKGNITISAMANSNPLITNTAGSVVTLANGNQVSGFNIQALQAGSIGIDGTSGINGATINNNNIFGSVAHVGIGIIGQGVIEIDNNTLTQMPAALGDGINLLVLDGTFMQATISNNTVFGYTSPFGDGAIAFSPNEGATTASADCTIIGNTISNFGLRGITYSSGMPNATCRIIENTINNNTGSNASISIAVAVSEAPNSGTAIIDRNLVVTTTPSTNTIGILSEINGAATGLYFQTFVTNNTVTTGSGTGSTGINIQTVSNGVICAGVTNNQVIPTAPGNNDLSITTSGTGIINLQNFEGNIYSTINIAGNVNYVTSCD